LIVKLSLARAGCKGVRSWLSSLRARLLLIVLVAVIPAFLLAIWAGLEHRRHEVVAAQERALTLARQLADEQEQLIEGARHLLVSLSGVPALLRHETQACDAILAEALTRIGHPYTNLVAVKPNGDAFCTALPKGEPVNLADRAYVRRALERREFAESEYLVGRFSGKPILSLAYPAIDGTGAVRAVIVAGLDLRWLGETLARSVLPTGAAVGVIDRNGNLLARHAESEKERGEWMGKPGPSPIIAAIRTREREGIVSGPGVDRVPQIFAFTRLRGREWELGSWVYVGIPVSTIFAVANRLLAWQLAGLSVAAALTIVVAHVFGHAFLTRRMDVLAAAAGRLGAGDLRARTGLPHDTGTLGELAHAFDEMADALERDREALWGEHARLVETLESISDGFITLDGQWRFTYVNASAERLLRFKRGDALGKSLWGLFPDAVGSPFGEAFRRAMREHVSMSVEAFYPPLGGWFEARAFPTPDGLTVYVRDISARKVAEEALTWQASTSAAFAEVGRALLDPGPAEEAFQALLRQAQQLTGSASGFVAYVDARTGHLVKPTMTPEVWDRCEVPGEEIAFRERRGLWGWVLTNRLPLLTNDARRDPRASGTPDGHIPLHRILAAPATLGETAVGLVAVANAERDYTERDLAFVERLAALLAIAIQRKRAEDEIEQHREARMQSEKLAVMTELLAGVAHELNNPLSVIVGHAQILRRTAGDERLLNRANKLVGAAERCARLVKNFLAIARRHPVERQEVQLNDVAREAVELLGFQLRLDNVEVSFELAENLPPLAADPHQLHQVVVNLVTNAHHALRTAPPPRRLTLATGCDRDAGRVWLEVADSGHGIAPENEARLFEPFFTTKPVGEGTGLGLPICKGIVESHGGTIRLVRSAGGEGTVFRVELPVTAAPTAAARSPETESPAALRSVKVLVVDDEPDLSEMLADVLKTYGHEVDTAPNGVVALETLGSRSYDLILSDIRMPELDGPGLYREVARRDPMMSSRFIFLTGDTLGSETRAFIEESAVPTIKKPFAVDEILRVMQETIKRSDGARQRPEPPVDAVSAPGREPCSPL
jgi:PAS domain S-box-containing protein